MNPRDPNYEHCVTCHLKQVEEQKRKEQEAERQRQWEEERQRQQAEHMALEALPWFPALERYLDERFQEHRRRIEDWVGENYVRDNTDDGW